MQRNGAAPTSNFQPARCGNQGSQNYYRSQAAENGPASDPAKPNGTPRPLGIALPENGRDHGQLITFPPDPADLVSEIVDYLRRVTAPGDLTELRIIDAIDDPKYPPHTRSGYFDTDHLGELARLALYWTGKAEGVYATMNPPLPDLLARAKNRARKLTKKDSRTTEDAEVARRVGIVVDADPIRYCRGVRLEGKFSTTDEEKARGWDRITAILDDLTGRGWPMPIVADSGNSYHLRYAIDLPADDGGLVQKVLKALAARYTDEWVDIDVKMFNASRISKLYWTMARKGDHTDARPHRQSRTISMPDRLEIVPTGLLEALADEAPAAEAGHAARAPGRYPNGYAAPTPAPIRWDADDRGRIIERARRCIMSPRFRESIAGQDGHGALFNAAACLRNDFGLTKPEGFPLFEEFNRTKAHPPEGDKQLHHKWDSVEKKYPVPSCKALEDDPPESNGHHIPSANGNGYAPGPPEGRRFKPGDRVVRWNPKKGEENQGTVETVVPKGYLMGFPTATKPIFIPEKDALRPVGGSPSPAATAVDESADIEDIEILDRWPKLDEAALHGVVGDIVRLADPHTEADPAAILIQLLVAFGNVIGRSVYFKVGATRHFLKLFAVLVGGTATGRKGTSWDVVKWILGQIDEEWVRRRVQSGLVSGEGLIHHVRDKRYGKPDPKGTKNAPPSEALELVDPGVDDKRLLVIESEMDRMLKSVNREGNTLGDVIRQAWDQDDLFTMGKHQPSRSTGAHVSLVCHVTKADVTKHMTETESANGFANRFLWPCSRRSKFLPEGGDLDSVDWGDVVRRLRQAFQFAASFAASEPYGRMTRDGAARAIWHGLYEELSAGKPGVVGKILSRAEAQVMRIACIYAVLDCSRQVQAAHLAAAVAVWDYCEASARFVFGDDKGDPDADKLVAALKETTEGLTRTQILVDVFGRHRKAGDIAALLTRLVEDGVIHSKREASGGGRPAERWFFGRRAN
jgi:hypothetical protein